MCNIFERKSTKANYSNKANIKNYRSKRKSIEIIKFYDP